MEKASPKRFSEFIEVALRAGATAARIIPSRHVVIDERVRLKCEVRWLRAISHLPALCYVCRGILENPVMLQMGSPGSGGGEKH